MSAAALSWFQKQTFPSLSLRSLVQVLARASNDVGHCYRSQASLADELGVSARHVRGMLATLEKLRVVKRTKRSAGFRGRTSDMIVLALAGTFALGRGMMSTAREVLRDKVRSAVRLARKVLARPANFASGTPVPGNKHYPTKEGVTPTRTGACTHARGGLGWAYALASGRADAAFGMGGAS